MMITNFDLLQYLDGCEYRWELEDSVLEGIIVVEDDHVYVLHNDSDHDGSTPCDMHGYDYSWLMYEDDFDSDQNEGFYVCDLLGRAE